MSLTFQQVKRVVEIMEYINDKKLPSSTYNEQTKFNIDTILIERNEDGECQNIYINYSVISKEIFDRYQSTLATEPFSSYVTEIEGEHGKIFQIGWYE